MRDDPFLDNLTDPQRDAVCHVDGPLLVLAGAGSGKTRVITRRAARLARQFGPQHILAITFTNKAAEEMRGRIESLIGGGGRTAARGGYGSVRGMWVCTFHSLCARLLRLHAEAAGLQPNFTIFDQADRLGVIRTALAECGLSTDQWRPRTIEQTISNAKNEMRLPPAFAADATDFYGRTVARVYTRYQELLTRQNAVDFDDLLLKTAMLLRDNADARESVEGRFRYTLIDEYQDTNHAQYLIARALTATHRNLCATGDPDQSIYAWRGADINNILDFERDYPDAKVVRLEQNYRSTRRVLAAASHLIAHNHRRKKKDLWTENDTGAAVRVWNCRDEHDEANRITADIEAYCADGGSPGDAAIFYRVTALTRVLEDALRRAKLPYQIARGVEFYNRKEIKDVLSYVRVLCNPADDTACERAINTPARGIGKTTIERLMDHARQKGVALRAALAQAERLDSLKTAKKKVAAFAALLDAMSSLPPYPVRAFLDAVVKQSGLEKELKADPDPEQSALANVEELISAAAEYDAGNPEGSVAEWLSQVSLVSDTDKVDLAGGAVTLMTLHAAKGLEFPAVYIAGLEEGLLPHARARESRDDDAVEEERRLCFVGMTRAKQRLTLTRAEYRLMRGFSERTLESQFLRELPEDDVQFEDFTDRANRRPNTWDITDGDPDHDAFDFDQRLLTRGRLVRHAEYGVGRITSVNPEGRQVWVRVKFTAYGERSFALQHAELEVVEP